MWRKVLGRGEGWGLGKEGVGEEQESEEGGDARCTPVHTVVESKQRVWETSGGPGTVPQGSLARRRRTVPSPAARPPAQPPFGLIFTTTPSPLPRPPPGGDIYRRRRSPCCSTTPQPTSHKYYRLLLTPLPVLRSFSLVLV